MTQDPYEIRNLVGNWLRINAVGTRGADVKTFTFPHATVVSVHDGDTVRVDIVLYGRKSLKLFKDRDLGFNIHKIGNRLILRNQSVRLVGCNAPELSTPEGKASQAFLAGLLPVGSEVELVSYGWDKYGGRIAGAIFYGTNIVESMIAAGHAKWWDGKGPKPV